jgi:hypothetical protein
MHEEYFIDAASQLRVSDQLTEIYHASVNSSGISSSWTAAGCKEGLSCPTEPEVVEYPLEYLNVDICFYSLVAMAAVFQLLVALFPDKMIRFNSAPWSMQLRRNLDLDHQGVIFAAFHTSWWGRASHWTCIWDALCWFIFLQRMHPALACCGLALLVFQSVAAQQRINSILLTTFWMLVYTTSWLLSGHVTVPWFLPLIKV